MTIDQNFVTTLLAIAALLSAVAGGVRWLVKHYLWELRPNHGSSLNDRVARLEKQLDTIYKHLIGDSVA